MARKPRALIAVRLSLETGTTTSPERQLAECTAYCERRGWEVVGIAKDLSVSASTTPPWKRPDLGAWLDDRAPEFDHVVFWRLDRFVRKVGDLQVMIEWAKAHGGKGLVSATEPFDLTAPSGKAMATNIATFAHMESRAVSERVASMRAHLLTTDRWGGGRAPYGYKIVDRNGAKYLEIDKTKQKTVNEIADRIIGGESVNAIAADLQARKIPSPWSSNKKHKTPEHACWVWQPATVKRIMSSPALMGWKTRKEDVPGRKYKKTVVVHNSQGKKVRQAPPLLGEGKHAELTKALLDASVGGRKPRDPQTPFLDVLKCGGCGKNMTLHVTKKKRKDGSTAVTSKIRCLSRIGSPACKGYVFDPEAEIITPLMNDLIDEIGGKPVTRRIYVAGVDTTEKLDELEESIDYYVGQMKPGGLFAKGPAKAKAEKALAGLNSEYESLGHLGRANQDHWEYEELGMTFAQRWEGRSFDLVRGDLIRAGITMNCAPHAKGGHTLNIPQDLQERFAKALAARRP